MSRNSGGFIVINLATQFPFKEWTDLVGDLRGNKDDQSLLRNRLPWSQSSLVTGRGRGFVVGFTADFGPLSFKER